MRRIFFQTCKYLAGPLLILGGIIAYPYFINEGKILAGNDTSFFEFFSSEQAEKNSHYWKYNNGIGGATYQSHGEIYYLRAIGFIVKLTSPETTQVLTKIFFYSIAFIGVYLLLREYALITSIRFSNLVAILVSFFYCTNLLGFDLVRTWLYLYYIFYLATPLLLYFFIRYCNTNSHWMLLGIATMSVLMAPIFSNVSFPMILYMMIFIIYIIFFPTKFVRMLFVIVLISLINISSFLGYFLTFTKQQSVLFSNDTNIQLNESAPIVQKKFFPMQRVMRFDSGRLYGERWSSLGSVPAFSLASFYDSWFFRIISFIPIIIITLIFINKNRLLNTKTPSLYVYVTFSLFLIALSLLSLFGFDPLSNFWQKLFNTIPALWVFRNTVKFALIVVILSCFLLYYSIVNKKYLTHVFIVYLLILNIYTLSGNFIDKSSLTKLPNNYALLEKNLTELPKGLADKITSFPPFISNWLSYDFGYTGMKPTAVLQNTIPNFSSTSDAANSYNSEVYRALSDSREENLPYIFERYSIKYVLLHHDLFYGSYKLDQSKYSLSKNFLDSNYKKVIDNNNYSVYQTYSDNTPLVKVKNAVVQMLNPSHIKIHLNQIQESELIVLRQFFDDGWKMRIDPIKSNYNDLCANKEFKSTFNSSMNLTECSNSKYSDDSIRYLLSSFNNRNQIQATPLSSNMSEMSWTISKQKILDSLSDHYYQKNPDGSISANISLFYKPQAHFLLLQLISFFSFLCILCYVIIRLIVDYNKDLVSKSTLHET